ncbi:glycosyl hydrolase family 18 protein [Desulfitobacterium chlororespirans]|uniref:Glycosyl hydrolases family 18 n=1 Tax=Desulfitobacterium chlororespirans DSM 11544 TaxID=1121395 RepID=A0A1M7TI13_9FIRM|nr:glycosyl hydrolase family 18 protein [Desulfitobacterium chlororespirans]SHN70248.1 Glycosyl hydrolases family 18 [Desulfitobacterium chlororespirans DSM 11544]
MKRFLTLNLIAVLVLSFSLVGCNTAQQQNTQAPNQIATESGEPPKAEAETRQDVLGEEKRVVMGFYTDPEGEIPGSKESMMKNIKMMDEVSFFWYSFDANGKILTTGKKDLSIKEAAQKNGAKAYALIHNMRGGLFDANLAHSVFANPQTRSKFINNIVQLVLNEKWDGVAIDIEKTPPADRNNFTAFLGELHGALKAKDKVLNVSIPAKFIDYPSDLWSGAYDYASIGKNADQIVLMTYDEHGLGTTHGPISSHAWVNKVISYAVTKIPREKIVLGLPVYSFDWGSNKPTMPDYLSYEQSMARAKKHGVEVGYDEEHKVPWYTYTANGVRHEVYFENKQSLQPKMEYAREHKLHGVAIWRLGMEDPSIWDSLVKTYGTNKNKK